MSANSSPGKTNEARHLDHNYLDRELGEQRTRDTERAIDARPREREIEAPRERGIEARPRERDIDARPKERSIEAPKERQIERGIEAPVVQERGIEAGTQERGIEAAIDSPSTISPPPQFSEALSMP